jgi:hypothetical protein
MQVRAWTNNCHNTTLGTRFPDCTVENAFGDRYITSLCPANGDVRSYVCALAADVARYEIDALVVESLCYQPFDHGYHHERSHYSFSDTIKFFLGMCFCPDCLSAGRANGVSIEAIRAYVRTQLDLALCGQSGDFTDVMLTEPEIASLLEGQVGGYLDARKNVVTTLVEQVYESVRSSRSATKLLLMDWSGALGSYATGSAAATPCPSRSWQDGVDLARVIGSTDGIVALGYTHDLEHFTEDVDAYRDLVPRDKALCFAVRPMPPDCFSIEDLRGKVNVARTAGVEWIEFYHYGLMRSSSFDWMREARQDSRATVEITKGG